MGSGRDVFREASGSCSVTRAREDEESNAETLRARKKHRAERRAPFAEAALGEPEWELLVYTRQFS